MKTETRLWKNLILSISFIFGTSFLFAESEPNNDVGSANVIALNGNESGAIDGTDHVDWFKITTIEDGRLILSTTNDNVEFYLRLFDADSVTQLYSSYKYFSGAGGTITYNNLLPGTYFIKIERSTGTGTYTIDNVFQNALFPIENEINDSSKFANALLPSDSTTGHIGYYGNGYTDNTDWYKVTTTVDGKLTVSTTNENSTEFYVRLYDADTTYQLKSSYKYYSGSGGVLTYSNLLPNTYFIKIERYAGYGSYSIKTSFDPASYTIDVENNDSAFLANWIMPNDSISGHIGNYSNGYTDSNDWFKLTTNEDGRLTISTTNENTGEFYVRLYDADTTTQLVSTYKYYSGSGGVITYANLLPSTYFVKIELAAGFGSYTLKSEFEKATFPIDIENNDSSFLAIPIFDNDSLTGHLGYYSNGYTDKDDWYKVTTLSDGKLTVSTTNENTTEFYVRLYDADQSNQLVSAYKYYSGTGGVVTYTNLLPNTYFIKIERSAGYGSYSLKTEFVNATYPIDIENNDSSAVSNIILPNDSLTGHLGYYSNGYTDNDDWYKLTTLEDGKLTLTTSNENTAEFYVRLYDADTSNQLASAYKYYTGSGGVVTYTNLLPNTYFIKIERSAGYGSYSLKTEFVNATYPIDIENNDSSAVSNIILPNDSLTGHLGYYSNGYTDNDDWYKLTTLEDGKLTLTTSNENTTEFYVRLYDADTTNLLVSSYKYYSGSGGVITYHNLLPNTYFVKIERSAGYGSYSLKSEFLAPVDSSEIEINDSLEVSIPLQATDSVLGHIGYYSNGYTDRSDWYSVFIPSNGKLVIESTNDNTAQYYVRLYDTLGTNVLVDFFKYSSGSGGPITSGMLQGGKTYYIKIERNNGYGTYHLKTTFLQGPIAKFDYVQNLYAISFNDSSLYANSYAWDFGDGSSSLLVNPQHTYTQPGVYDVCLVAKNAVGTDQMCKNVVIKGIQKIVTNKAGNLGYATVTVYGGGLTSNSLIRLERSGYSDIVGDTVIKPSLGTLKTTFLLDTAEIGLWNFVVEIPNDTTFVIIDGFTIEAANEADVWATISGRNKILYNRWQTYNINYGNTGNVDAHAAPIWIVVSDIPGLELDFLNVIPSLPTDADSIWHVIKDSVAIYFTIDSLNGEPFKARVYPLFIPNVPAYYLGSIDIKIKSPADFKIITWVNPSYFDELKKSSEYANCVMWAQAKALTLGLVGLIANQIPGAACLSSVSQAGYGLAYGENTLGSGLYTITKAAIDCVWDLGSQIPVIKAWALTKEIFSLATNIYDSYGENEDCKKKFLRDDPDDKDVKAVASFDPNEIIGPKGFNTANYYRKNENYGYTIFFENHKDSATAPAQEVFLYDTLDLTKYDIKTFSFGEISFGDTTFYPQNESRAFTKDVDMIASKNLIVRITATLDTLNGVAKWTFVSLDPVTMDLTQDPLGGFLPPNVNSPEGEGHVAFNIKLKNTVNDGDLISNKADIRFDLNKSFPTNQWDNIIDLKAPTSSVQSLPSTVQDTVFQVNWVGTDQESGIMLYNIYVAVDNGPTSLWIGNTYHTSAAFVGQIGSTYGFYSLAIDSTGNTEVKNGNFDVTTELVVGIKDFNTTGLFEIYPNPARDNVNITLNLSNAENIVVELIDMQGRQVKMKNYGKLNNGVNKMNFSVEGFSDGVYFLKINDSQLEKLVLNN